MRDPRTSWICSSGPVRTGNFSAVHWRSEQGVHPRRGASPGAGSAGCASTSGTRRLGEGGVNEVMEAANQEVITLESNLPRIRRCRFRVGSPGAVRLPGGALAVAAGHRAAVKLGTRHGRVARFTPVAEEPGSDWGCCLPAASATLSGQRGRSWPRPRTEGSHGDSRRPPARDFRMDEVAPGDVRRTVPAKTRADPPFPRACGTPPPE